MGLFVAGEGRRYYGRTTTASMAHRTVCPCGSPSAWPGSISVQHAPSGRSSALCGNRCSTFEEARACSAGVAVNVVHGLGSEAGAALVEHPGVDLVSFTGSAATGRWIAETAGRRLAKVCLELGGKNALVVCDDADLDAAVRWAVQSSFSNAGQRCAAASRIVVFDAVYDEFRRASWKPPRRSQTPVPSSAKRASNVSSLPQAKATARGGERLPREGWWLPADVRASRIVDTPTRRSRAPAARPGDDPLSGADLRGARGRERLAVRHAAPCTLRACTARWRSPTTREAGVVVVNGGTHGSEPHMGFGGVKQSGTGWREAGVEALDVYSEWKYVNLISQRGAR